METPSRDHLHESSLIAMSTMTVSMVFMLLNGWLAKGSFDRQQNTFGWFWVFLSAWNFAEVLNMIF